ncbi:DNA and RNA helicase [Paenibacillus sp. IHBB 3054]|uniref:DNA and RNA helicase n=1 Tax=Paenibacillus sp. IHBB 3054 TaxID=3425689 RepID=UPI003F67F12A
MFTYTYPEFHKGRILKIRMLEDLRDFPRQFWELYYRDYADGIVSGAEVEVHAERLSVSPGILLYEGRLYMMTEPAEIAYKATGQETVLKLRFTALETGHDLSLGRSSLALEDAASGTGSHEMELARFKLKEGARLRKDYQSFADLATEYNTLQVLQVPYAAPGASTLPPAVLQDYAQRLMRTGTPDPHDVMFGMLCMNEGVITRSVILHYIASRLGQEYRDYPSLQIHRYLDRILSNARGGQGHKGQAHGGMQRMLVD